MNGCEEKLCNEMEELEILRAHVLHLEQKQEQQTNDRLKNQQTERALQERIKELNCLYNVTELLERYEDSQNQALLGIVELLPQSWQYPHSTCARIIFEDQTYQTSNFRTTRWKQEAGILIAGRHVGMIEVYYLKKQPYFDEGPFLKEERLLINAISERIAKTAEKNELKRQLENERQALKKANAALHDALMLAQQEKKTLGEIILANIEINISPILFALKSVLSSKHLTYATLLQQNLTKIIEPFVERSQAMTFHLSPAELLICNMIKHGLSTKEIAEIRGISPDTVNRHRENIRRKLGLTNRKMNLSSYLNGINGNAY